MLRTVIALSLACAVLALTLAYTNRDTAEATALGPQSTSSWAQDTTDLQPLPASSRTQSAAIAAPTAAAAPMVVANVAQAAPVAAPVELSADDQAQIEDDAAAVGMTTMEPTDQAANAATPSV